MLNFEMSEGCITELRDRLEEQEACDERSHQLLGCPNVTEDSYGDFHCDDDCQQTFEDAIVHEAPSTFSDLVKRLQVEDITWLLGQVGRDNAEKAFTRFGMEPLTLGFATERRWVRVRPLIVENNAVACAFIWAVNDMLYDSLNGTEIGGRKTFPIRITGNPEITRVTRDEMKAIIDQVVDKMVIAEQSAQIVQLEQQMREMENSVRTERSKAANLLSSLEQKAEHIVELNRRLDDYRAKADKREVEGTYGRVVRVYVNGSTVAGEIAQDLTEKSRWFMVQPEPDDVYRFTLKHESGWEEVFGGISLEFKTDARELTLSFVVRGQ